MTIALAVGIDLTTVGLMRRPRMPFFVASALAPAGISLGTDGGYPKFVVPTVST
jgi:hypothetical protein